ncbi:MAG: hypothetical protein E2O38_13465 [Proteobacteria bacterium]|nr:MAG: hypothetical protein E2O38_13465 [Pseudomonadota bacterium]
MHSDVFIRRDDWLDPYLERMDAAGVGAWKLELENPLYALQKVVINNTVSAIKNLFGKKKHISWRRGHYPRDYCAMYRRDVILECNLLFRPAEGEGGGYAIAKRLSDIGYRTSMIPISELDQKIVHIAHGTAAVVAEKPLHHKRAQTKVERRVQGLFSQDWVRALQTDSSLDD